MIFGPFEKYVRPYRGRILLGALAIGIGQAAAARIPLLVGDAIFLLAPEMEKAKISYRLDVPGDLEAVGDPEQIKRALFNLMKNAVQAMRDGGQLVVSSRLEHDAVAVDVRDTGPGISPEIRQRLFEPFFST